MKTPTILTGILAATLFVSDAQAADRQRLKQAILDGPAQTFQMCIEEAHSHSSGHIHAITGKPIDSAQLLSLWQRACAEAVRGNIRSLAFSRDTVAD